MEKYFALQTILNGTLDQLVFHSIIAVLLAIILAT
jgi:hypothetical protein